MGVTPAEPATGPAAPGAAAAVRPLISRLRVAAVTLSSACILGAVVWIAAELAAARVPEHRAALEDLIRHETGLDVSFRELTLRWGWYGPEAVFHAVALGEPGADGPLLRARQLVVGLDLWRMARSGHLEAGRITLVNPNIDLGHYGQGVRGPALASGRSAGTREAEWNAGARLLSGWRGGRIELEGGTLLLPVPGEGQALTFNIRHAQLRRLGARWSADALVLLPERLGERAHVALELTGDPAQPRLMSGTLSIEGRRLEFAGWHALAQEAAFASFLPQAGSGNLELRAVFAQGGVLEADGTVGAAALEWRAPAAAASALALERLRGAWQLRRRGGAWYFVADSLELTRAPAHPASLSIAAAGDGSWARGTAQHLPLPALLALARWHAAQLPVDDISFAGEARRTSFEWSRARPAGARLATSAELADVVLAMPAHDVVLSGLSGRVSGAGGRLLVELTAHGAQLTLAGGATGVLDDLDVNARLRIGAVGGGWQVSSDGLEIRRGTMILAASGALSADAAAAPARVSAHVALRDADAALLVSLLGTERLAALGAAAAHLSAGRIERADFELRGPVRDAVARGGAGAQFRGALSLRDARVTGGELWPDAEDLDARIDWRGTRIHAAIERARSGELQLTSGRADWDARGEQATRLAGRLSGTAQQLLGWVREHPQVAARAPGVQDIDLHGNTRLDIGVTLPAARHGAAQRPPRVRVVAMLDGAQLSPVAGLPPIEALHGTLAFANAQLLRSTLSGRWLGGPVSLSVAERREHGDAALTITGRGSLAMRAALQAAGGSADELLLSGSAEWSARVAFRPGGTPGESGWQLRADSNLIGVTSALPEPFAKPQAAALPLHLELQGTGEHGELRVSLSDRLRARVALARSGEAWRIDRGAVRLASSSPALPRERLLDLDGRVSRLDLPAYLALLRQAGGDPALPALRAHLSAARLVAGARSYSEVNVLAGAARGAGQLELNSAELSATLRWPARIDGAHPAQAHLAGFDLSQPGDAALAAGLATLLAPAVQITVDGLQWRGRSLGRLAATLAARGDELEVSDARLAGASGETHAGLHCVHGGCRATFSLASEDAAATLASLGLRPELTARHAALAGELQWQPQAAAPLASLQGHLHMQLEDGVARTAAAAVPAAMPFALLSVPALVTGLSADAPLSEEPGLRFTSLTGDFELRDGGATTSDLHFDGDAEILIRGRVGLLAQDYDEQAWILRGEERLPDAVRRLGPTPRMAALWLSLRELFAGAAADRSRAALRLRGTWSDPIVTPR